MPTSKSRKRSTVSARISALVRVGKNDRLIAATAQRLVPPVRGRTTLAIDPGGSTGIAVRYPDGSWMSTTLTQPSELWDFMIEKPDHVVFEIFSTGGRVDKYMIYTIELVGGIKAAIYALNLHGFAHSPGKRYPYLNQATEMLRGQGHTRHEIDALAHLLAHEDRP